MSLSLTEHLGFISQAQHFTCTVISCNLHSNPRVRLLCPPHLLQMGKPRHRAKVVEPELGSASSMQFLSLNS